MTKATVTAKGNVKLTMTDREASFLRAVLAASVGTVLHDAYEAIDNLAREGLIEYRHLPPSTPTINENEAE